MNKPCVRTNTHLQPGSKGLYANCTYIKDELIFILSGEEYDHPTRESIHIGNGKHIYDELGIFINHSFEPSVYIDGKNVKALKSINIDDELTFNYNNTEINMACPFYVDNILVCGYSNN
jgi:hypothetical protein